MWCLAPLAHCCATAAVFRLAGFARKLRAPPPTPKGISALPSFAASGPSAPPEGGLPLGGRLFARCAGVLGRLRRVSGHASAAVGFFAFRARFAVAAGGAAGVATAGAAGLVMRPLRAFGCGSAGPFGRRTFSQA